MIGPNNPMAPNHVDDFGDLPPEFDVDINLIDLSRFDDTAELNTDSDQDFLPSLDQMYNFWSPIDSESAVISMCGEDIALDYSSPLESMESTPVMEMLWRPVLPVKRKLDIESIKTNIKKDHDYLMWYEKDILVREEKPALKISPPKRQCAPRGRPRKVGRPRKYPIENTSSDIENQNVGVQQNEKVCRSSNRKQVKSKCKTVPVQKGRLPVGQSNKRGTAAKRDHKEMERQRRNDMKVTLDTVRKSIPPRFVTASRKSSDNLSKADVLVCSKRYVTYIYKSYGSVRRNLKNFKNQVSRRIKSLRRFKRQFPKYIN